MDWKEQIYQRDKNKSITLKERKMITTRKVYNEKYREKAKQIKKKF